MIDQTAIYATLVSIVESITGSPCVIAEQNAPRPTGEYSTVLIVSRARFGWDSITYENQADPDLDLVETIEGQRGLMVSFNFFRGDATMSAGRVKLLIQSSGNQEILKAAGLGLGESSEVREISEVVSKATEDRAQFDIEFNAVESGDVITRSILSAEIDGVVEIDGHQSPVTINVQE